MDSEPTSEEVERKLAFCRTTFRQIVAEAQVRGLIETHEVLLVIECVMAEAIVELFDEQSWDTLLLDIVPTVRRRIDLIVDEKEAQHPLRKI